MPGARPTFDAQMHALEQRLLSMGSFVEGMLESSVKALIDQDVALAREVIRRDDVADDLNVDIEMTCMRLLALQHPVSRDLRTIGTTLKIITDLERIGDYAVDIARASLELALQPHRKPLTRIPRMAEITSRMVRGALEVFVGRNLAKIDEIVALDDEVDELNIQVWQGMIGEMEQDARSISRATHLIIVARSLERIADHAVNVAERVQYMETGDLRPFTHSFPTP